VPASARTASSSNGKAGTVRVPLVQYGSITGDDGWASELGHWPPGKRTFTVNPMIGLGLTDQLVVRHSRQCLAEQQNRVHLLMCEGRGSDHVALSISKARGLAGAQVPSYIRNMMHFSIVVSHLPCS
jgi:hypothetical protein